MKYDHDQLQSMIQGTLQREGEAIVRQFVARDLTMTSRAWADFEVELRNTLHELAMKHSKSIYGRNTIM